MAGTLAFEGVMDTSGSTTLCWKILRFDGQVYDWSVGAFSATPAQPLSPAAGSGGAAFAEEANESAGIYDAYLAVNGWKDGWYRMQAIDAARSPGVVATQRVFLHGDQDITSLLPYVLAAAVGQVDPSSDGGMITVRSAFNPARTLLVWQQASDGGRTLALAPLNG